MKQKTIDIKRELVGSAAARVVLCVGDRLADGKDCIISDIYKDTDIVYSHVVKVLLGLDKIKLITTHKHGRVRSIKLTERGNFLYQYLWSIRKFFDEGKSNNS